MIMQTAHRSGKAHFLQSKITQKCTQILAAMAPGSGSLQKRSWSCDPKILTHDSKMCWCMDHSLGRSPQTLCLHNPGWRCEHVSYNKICTSQFCPQTLCLNNFDQKTRAHHMYDTLRGASPTSVRRVPFQFSPSACCCFTSCTA